MERLLVANRAEVATRVLHTTGALGIPTVAVCAADDTPPAWAGQVERLEASGPAAYLDIPALVALARGTRCDAVHPGWGFLAESAPFARACADAGLTFVGPSPAALATFGDKTAARALAREVGVEVLPGAGVTPDGDQAAAREFVAAARGPVLVKAVAGGGGRGIRLVTRPDELADAVRRCASEAGGAFGNREVYLERLLPEARHLEVQLVGDATGAVRAIGDRDCSLQRRRQKLVEIAPAPGLPDAVRHRLWSAAEAVGSGVDRLGVATAEFLVTGAGEIYFLEVNARLQVEHTVTEQVTGLDLVAVQLRLADGATLADVDCASPPVAAGVAIQARVNAERLTADGDVVAGAGEVTVFVPPTGRGVRVDTHAGPGYRVSPRYDTLLAKVIGSAADLATAATVTERALGRFVIEGVPTNRALLEALLRHSDLGRAATSFVDERLATLLPAAPAPGSANGASTTQNTATQNTATQNTATQDTATRNTAARETHQPDPGAPRTARPNSSPDIVAERALADGLELVRAPRAGVVVELPAAEGTRVGAGAPAAVLEAMKMEYVVPAPTALRVREVLVEVGQAVAEGAALLAVEPAQDTADVEAASDQADRDLDQPRPDLAEVLDRQRGTRDEGRPAAVAKRHSAGRLTAREQVAALCDPGTFVEYGSLTVAAQRRRRDLDDLIANTPGDGMITGTARIGGRRVAVLCYDYTVLAGTQGVQNHRKTDRLLELALREKLPTVIFAEGGGGRPGDTDQPGFTGLDVPTFRTAALLPGQVPLVGVVSGYCFAGNAALAAVCDVLIATEGTSLGMGGPAMIAGGGLGDVAPGDVGPIRMHYRTGVIDVLVDDDTEAVAVARRYLGYLGDSPEHTHADQRSLRWSVPENRVRAYPVRPVLRTLFDTDSVLELRAGYGHGMVTAFARLNGQPVGVFANNPDHLGGAIDTEAADKTARFLGVCEHYRLPVVSLCDTPGFMVGPDAERTGLVRAAGAMFAAGAQLTVPLAMIVLRKGYGLGAMAMAGGAVRQTAILASWPTGEFGGMNLEGAARLGYRKELDAITDPVQRQQRLDELIARAYRHGKALSTATVFDIDDVIDPAATRAVLTGALGLAG